MSKKKSRVDRPMKSIHKLDPDFKESIAFLELRLKVAGVAMVRWETLRTDARQAYLKRTGASKAGPGQSPHNYGLAVDYILNRELVDVQKREWPEGSGKFYPDAWDTESEEAIKTWVKFGEIVRSIPGLEWGGGSRLGGNPAWDRVFNSPDGDFPHVQKENWRAFKKER